MKFIIKGLSISKEDFEVLRKAVIEQGKNYSDRFLSLKQKWETAKE